PERPPPSSIGANSEACAVWHERKAGRYARDVSTEGWIFMVGFRIFDVGLLILWMIWFFRLRDDEDDFPDDDGPGGGGPDRGPGPLPGGGGGLRGKLDPGP